MYIAASHNIWFSYTIYPTKYLAIYIYIHLCNHGNTSLPTAALGSAGASHGGPWLDSPRTARVWRRRIAMCSSPRRIEVRVVSVWKTAGGATDGALH